jgi:methylated-DNA-[protein]-cysteine S-methyltransferase
MKIYYTIIKSPLGQIFVIGSERGLNLLTFSKEEWRKYSEKLKIKNEKLIKNDGFFSKLKRELKDYFSGKKVEFKDKLDFSSGTEFQRRVWKEMREIPYGETRSYMWLAKKVGNSKKARAVGNACGANRFPIIVPCHRVIKEDGGLGGFSGGIETKKKLLKLEKVELR